MPQTIEATFDGKVFRPNRKLKLKPNKNYILVVNEKVDISVSNNAWNILDQLTGNIEAPEDWSIEHDHYLYGAPRKKG